MIWLKNLHLVPVSFMPHRQAGAPRQKRPVDRAAIYRTLCTGFFYVFCLSQMGILSYTHPQPYRWLRFT
jgi:hypothetical protein